MAALSAAGLSARQIDYTLTPPSREELKKLSVMLREANQSLARRYEPLFMELQLDDRFISEAEFLTGIHEHPTLINGPILATPGKARICRTAEDVQTFLHNGASEEKRPKGISPPPNFRWASATSMERESRRTSTRHLCGTRRPRSKKIPTP